MGKISTIFSIACCKEVIDDKGRLRIRESKIVNVRQNDLPLFLEKQKTREFNSFYTIKRILRIEKGNGRHSPRLSLAQNQKKRRR